MERQSRFAYRVAYAVLLNAHDAEDAVQETFLKLFRHGGWQQAENERAYLARVAMRTAIDRRRAARPAATGGRYHGQDFNTRPVRKTTWKPDSVAPG